MNLVKIAFVTFGLMLTTGAFAQTHEGKAQSEKTQEASKEKEGKKVEEVKSENAVPVRKTIKTEARKMEVKQEKIEVAE